MFGRTKGAALQTPPNASRADSVEVLRVWAVPGEPQQVVLKTTWHDPAAWGLLLADVARHAAKAYANEGHNEAEVLARILQFQEAEFAEPTDSATQIS